MKVHKIWKYAESLGITLQSCGDSGCVLGSPDGMCVNGGCRCPEGYGGKFRPNFIFRQLAFVAQRLLERIELVENENEELRKVLKVCEGARSVLMLEKQGLLNELAGLGAAQEAIDGLPPVFGCGSLKRGRDSCPCVMCDSEGQ